MTDTSPANQPNTRPTLGLRSNFKKPTKPNNGDGHTKLLRGLQAAGAKVTLHLSNNVLHRDVVIVASDRYTITIKPAIFATDDEDTRAFKASRRILVFKNNIIGLEYSQTAKPQ